MISIVKRITGSSALLMGTTTAHAALDALVACIASGGWICKEKEEAEEEGGSVQSFLPTEQAWYSGTEWAMLPLVRIVAAEINVSLLALRRQPMLDLKDPVLGLIQHSNTAQATMLCAFFGLGVEDVETLRSIAALRLQDQVTLFALAHEHRDLPIEQLLELAAPLATPNTAANAA
ncbi:MAG: hypothetical protein Q7T01_03160 [bacterium]|nr:hypothetical protein [bacterium]